MVNSINFAVCDVKDLPFEALTPALAALSPQLSVTEPSLFPISSPIDPYQEITEAYVKTQALLFVCVCVFIVVETLNF